MRCLRAMVVVSVLSSVVLLTEQAVEPPMQALAAATTVTLTDPAPAAFTVPAGVTSLQIRARGGQGGSYGSSPLTAGGRGGQIIVSVAVLPGDVFTFEIGRQGSPVAGGASERPGGWPDGGNGYVIGGGNGGGGGGSTRVYRTIDGVPTRLVVAAGGGGATSFWTGGDGGRTGGSGYGAAVPFDEHAVMSTGGTSSVGGSGACIDEEQDGSAGTCAQSGSQLAGGHAPGAGDGSWGGGGGGGGYFGGGAGIILISGAGGSSWYDASRVTFIDDSAVTATGDGVVELTYTIVECEAGTFGVDGKAPCTAARRGYYVPDRLADTELAAPRGTYTNETGQREVLRCAPGSYQPNEGQTSCIAAQPGYYVSDIGAVQQQRCPVGHTTTAPGATACIEVQADTTAPSAGPSSSAPETTASASSNPETTPPTTQAAVPSSPSVADTTPTIVRVLRTPRLPNIARSVKVRRSFLILGPRQRSIDGLKMSVSTRSKTCRVARSNNGFQVIGISKGVCSLTVRLTGNESFASRSITRKLIVS